MSNQQLTIKNSLVEADAGCITVDVAQKTIAAGLTGFEWGVGVPGTIGGAVRGNAGAAGFEMKDNVQSVDVYMDGDVVTLSNTACEFHYRDSIFKHSSGVILRATLALREGDSKVAFKQAIDNLQYRNQTQPQGFASIGCTFKNLEYATFGDVIAKHGSAIPDAFKTSGKIPAGWLVDQSGMKGAVVGKAEVSEKHGNFIINKKGAAASDVLSLIAQIKEQVYHKYGVELEEEIQII
jgi:UDP-N-acetylmuramate dehydrogenase